MVYLFLAEGFEEIEALTPVDVLRRAGINVETVAVSEKNTVKGSHGICVTADVNISDIEYKDVEAVILPGGLPGADNLENNEKVISFVKKAASEKKLVAAICAAPRILARKGLLDGKKATCYPGNEKDFTKAIYLCDGVVRDGNFITAKGMGKAAEFAFEIVRYLKDENTAEKIKNSIFA